MRTGLFDNSKNALVFGGCVLAAVVMFIGDESEDSTADLGSQTITYEERYVPPSSQRPSTHQPDIGDLSDFYGNAEDEAIDEAAGIDPVPSSTPIEAGSSPRSGITERYEQPPGIDGPGT